jgi:hypothetical protein|tara:strand:- start:477 stop:1187 length:711 start_codon:yes stop_codon:yes gene_type:complete
MALPKINTPTYELVVPSTGEEIRYRPFLVKEEKILLMAMESGDNKEIIRAIQDIVKECTYDKLKLSTMPMFDIEYLFLNIRAKSVGEITTLRLKCPDDEKTTVKVDVNLTEIEVQTDKNHTNKIELTDEMGIMMKYPTIDSFAGDMSEINASNMLEVISGCIDSIYDKGGEEVFEAKDQTKKELIEFIEQLNSKQFKNIQGFFDTMPKLKHTIKIKNPKTKKESEVVLQGLNDFFE